MVLSPEHQLIKNLESRIKNLEEVKRYIKHAQTRTEIQRTELSRDKTGVELKGVKAVNPATKEEIPIWIADYVLASYGTGAIMAVPAHDERDFEFAKKFKLPIKMVICPNYPAPVCPVLGNAYEGDGHLVDSGKFDGMDSEKAKWEITKFVGGKKQVQYHLRDWIFSRQRYWGEPIPLIFCNECKKLAESQKPKTQSSKLSEGEILNPGWVAVPEEDLPVKLPDVKEFKPTRTGESPLAAISSWVNARCPKCGGNARRETDTMPNWAGSSWYFLRYIDPRNDKALADQKKLKHWAPVDWYNGGMEHTTLHLLYSRFWNKFLYDIGAAPTSEPYAKRTSHGLILAESGGKMSKSKGNVVNPDFLVEKFGADALRIYEMFMGPFDQAIKWDHRGLGGTSRFLGKVWDIGGSRNISASVENIELERLLHRTIKKVGGDIESMNFNTAVSALMIFANACYELKDIPKNIWEKFLIILAPFAPFTTEELWSKLGHKSSIHLEKWPVFDTRLIEEERFELVIQVNGRVRDKVSLALNTPQKEAEKIALSRDKIKAMLGKRKAGKIIFVRNRLINIVVDRD